MKSEALRNDKFVYVGRKACGCVAGIVIDQGNDYTAQSVAEFIRDGLTVTRKSWDEYREISEEDTFMACPHGQTSLPPIQSGAWQVSRFGGSVSGKRRDTVYT